MERAPEPELRIHRRDLLVAAVTLMATRGRAAEPDGAAGPRYLIVTAASLKAQIESQWLANARGQVALISQCRHGLPGPAEGVQGRVWQGQPDQADTPFSIRLDDPASGARPNWLAYDALGRDSAVTLQDTTHQAILWKWVRPGKDWLKKYARINHVPLQLQAVEGPLAGQILDFGDPELVQRKSESNENTPSYVRRQALLSPQPGELSVLERREVRSY